LTDVNDLLSEDEATGKNADFLAMEELCEEGKGEWE
jgi:hypothetical protein